MIIPVELCLRAPGLLGRIVKYIESGAIYAQPQLSLCAAISALSVLKAHRVRSETNFRTNILSVALASSGEGKGHGLKAVSKLFQALERDYLLSGIPASNVGMMHALSETGKKLILWDEFGLDLKEMTSPKAPAYKAAIIKELMATFSAADIKSLGLQYKNNDGKNSRIDVDQPCLSLYGASTPIRFFESLNSTYVMDGFLPRLFIFEGLSGSKAKRDSFFVTQKLNTRDIADDIAERLPVSTMQKFNKPRTPDTISFGNGAAASSLYALIDHYENARIESPVETNKAIYARAAEHFIKLCLIAEDTKTVSLEVAHWAVEVTKYLVDTTIEVASKRVFDTEEEKKKGRLTDIITKAKLISRSQLVRSTQSMKNFEREQMIKDLLESEIIEIDYQITGNTRAKKTLFYKIK